MQYVVKYKLFFHTYNKEIEDTFDVTDYIIPDCSAIRNDIINGRIKKTITTNSKIRIT